MNRFVWGAMIAAFAVAWVVAQPPAGSKLKWPEAGQTLKYRVRHTTEQSFTQGENTGKFTSELDLLREWKVTAVDKVGTATLEMSISKMQMKRVNNDTPPWVFDSDNLEKSTPEMRGMTANLNKVLVTVGVDGFGQLVALKNTQAGNPFEHELPFLGVLPAEELKPGLKWERPFKLTLNPPLGTGEKYDAVQRFECKSVEKGKATVTLTTQLKVKPAAAADMIPLWQMLPAGELVWDLTTGQLEKGELKVKESLKTADGNVNTFESVKIVERVK